MEAGEVEPEGGARSQRVPGPANTASTSAPALESRGVPFQAAWRGPANCFSRYRSPSKNITPSFFRRLKRLDTEVWISSISLVFRANVTHSSAVKPLSPTCWARSNTVSFKFPRRVRLRGCSARMLSEESSPVCRRRASRKPSILPSIRARSASSRAIASCMAFILRPNVILASLTAGGMDAAGLEPAHPCKITGWKPVASAVSPRVHGVAVLLTAICRVNGNVRNGFSNAVGERALLR